MACLALSIVYYTGVRDGNIYKPLLLFINGLHFNIRDWKKWIKGYFTINNKCEVCARSKQCFGSSEGKITIKNL